MRSAKDKRQIRLKYLATCFVEWDNTIRQLQQVVLLLLDPHPELSSGAAARPPQTYGIDARLNERIPGINS